MIQTHGFDAPVFQAFSPARADGRAGVGLGVEIADGTRSTVLTVRHSDGTVLAARLDDAALERLCEALAIVIEHGNDVLMRARNDR